jgi:hypothetical protein
MTDRITKKQLDERVKNLNRRLNPTLTDSTIPFHEEARYVQIQGRNGYTALDEYQGLACVRTITVGTKREVADFLHAMMVGIDLSREAKSA